MSGNPEIPPPYRPGEPDWSRPDRPGPERRMPVPLVDLPGESLGARLLQRRTVLLSGVLDREATTALCAQLMALDGESAQDVRLVVNSDGGPLDDVLPVLDVLGLMRAAVDVTCVGGARGTAAVLVARGTGRRLLAPSATISLRCASPERAVGSADDVLRRGQELEDARTRIRDHLHRATGLPGERIDAEIERGDLLDARAAVELGIVDGVAERSAESGR